MGVRRGIFRVAKAIKILAHILGWLTVAASVALAISESSARIQIVGVGIVAGGLIIGIGHGLAWILEGFAPET